MSLLSFECRHEFPGGFLLELSFEVDHPVTSLFGPSGSGKTSVLSIIAGFLHPQQGRVLLGEETLLDTEARIDVPLDARRIGFVFQDHLLFPHLTVDGNLRYGERHRRGRRRKVSRDRVIDVLEIGGLLTRFPRNLSGGERQRVALGRALLSGPELLLMDEPLAALDAPLKNRILAYLERVVAEWNIPTLFVSHGQGEVRRLADWVLVIDNGRAVTSGLMEDVLSRPEPLAWKDATGPVNLLRLEGIDVHRDHAHGRIGDQSLYLPLEPMPTDSRLFVQFRPTDVMLSLRDINGLSARNHLHGRVCQVVELGRAVFIAVDIGQVFWAEVTPEAATDLGLQPGVEVTALLKAHNLHVVP